MRSIKDLQSQNLVNTYTEVDYLQLPINKTKMDLTNNSKNPLQLYEFPNKKRIKNSGRPRKNEKKLFSPPPRSIISLLLSKKSADPVVKPDICTVTVEKPNQSVKKEDKQWVCRHCSYRSCNKDIYKEHMISHKNQLHTCDYANCTYSTKSSSNLIKHKRTHTGEKPYICDKCVFRTNFQNSLTVHKRIHTSERPYACQYCDYRCNNSSNLKKHCTYRHPKIE